MLDPKERIRCLEKQEQLRQAERYRLQPEDELRRQAEIQRFNARILNSNCSCIGIRGNGEYTYLDGLVQNSNPAGGRATSVDKCKSLVMERK